VKSFSSAFSLVASFFASMKRMVIESFHSFEQFGVEVSIGRRLLVFLLIYQLNYIFLCSVIHFN
jgi:hypothetical protein